MSCSSHKSVRLLGVPLKQQGAHDALCGYYAAAMLLCTLRPEFEEAFEANSVELDPIFSNIRPRPGMLHARVCHWFTVGERLSTVTQALNHACADAGVHTRFAFHHADRSAATLKAIQKQIDVGLPSVLMWDSREMGNHTVTVVGYEHFGSSRTWLRVHDPSQIQRLLEWDQVVRHAEGPLHLISCVDHSGVRPQRMEARRGHRGELVERTRIEYWDVHAGAYVPIERNARR